MSDALDLTNYDWGNAGYQTYGAFDLPDSTATGSMWGGWEGALSNIVNAYGAVKTIDAQTDLAKAQAARQALQYPFGSTMTAQGMMMPQPIYYPVQQPQPAQNRLFGIPMPIVLIGGGLLAFLAYNSGR